MERTMEEYDLHDYLNVDVEFIPVSVKAKIYNSETEQERIENVEVSVLCELVDDFGEKSIEIDKDYMYDEVCDELMLTEDEECEIISFYY